MYIHNIHNIYIYVYNVFIYIIYTKQSIYAVQILSFVVNLVECLNIALAGC